MLASLTGVGAFGVLFKFLFDLALKIKTILQRVIGILKAIGKGLKAAAAYVVCLVSSAVFAGIKVLTKLLLDLLAAAFGLSGLKDAIKKLIQKFQELVMRLLARIAKFLGLKKKMGGKGCGKDKPCGPGKVGKDGKGCPVPPMKGMAGKPGGQKPKFSLKCNTGQCFREGTWTWSNDGKRAIESRKLGERIATWVEGESGYAASLATQELIIDARLYRAVWFVQEHADGYRVKVGLLRPLDWLAEHGIARAGAGDRVELDLPEMGVSGAFQVMAVEPCPALESGPGRLITGVFWFSRGVVRELHILGEPEPLGVTTGHPVWSLDREEWVPAGDLRVGERLSAADGRVAVVLGWDDVGDEPVCNLEVEGDHCYRVGELGLLVHNQSGSHGACEFWSSSHFASHPDMRIIYPPQSISGGPFNGQRRATMIEARLKKPLPMGEPPGCDPPGWKSNANTPGSLAIIARAHLLGRTLGGPGTCNNLVTACQKVNQRMYNEAESVVRNQVIAGKCVDYKVVANYGTLQDAIPNGITVEAIWTNADGSCGRLSVSFINQTNLMRC